MIRPAGPNRVSSMTSYRSSISSSANAARLWLTSRSSSAIAVVCLRVSRVRMSREVRLSSRASSTKNGSYRLGPTARQGTLRLEPRPWRASSSIARRTGRRSCCGLSSSTGVYRGSGTSLTPSWTQTGGCAARSIQGAPTLSGSAAPRTPSAGAPTSKTSPRAQSRE